jgi:photosystem II stability/assembly factor-like uncharacterized protein
VRARVGLICCLALLVGCTDSVAPSSRTSSPTASGPKVTSSAEPSIPGASPSPPVTSEIAFRPLSVTFISLQTGWVLGTRQCGQEICAALRQTTDAGRTWADVSPPPATVTFTAQSGVREVRFADPDDGWVFGSELWATHDGGAHWRQQDLPGASAGNYLVSSLETSAGVVHAAVIDPPSVTMYSSPVGSDSWQISPTRIEMGAGPVPHAQIVLQRSAGWIVEVDRTVIGGARLVDGSWMAWQPPCSSAGGGVRLAVASTTSLVAICDEGVWVGGPPVTRAYFSADGGGTFKQAIGKLPLYAGSAVATGTPGTAVVGYTGSDGVAQMLATFDRGATWTTVYRGPAGLMTFIGFTSSSQGVAILDSQSTGLMLMTFDGGRSWNRVSL